MADAIKKFDNFKAYDVCSAVCSKMTSSPLNYHVTSMTSLNTLMALSSVFWKIDQANCVFKYECQVSREMEIKLLKAL